MRSFFHVLVVRRQFQDHRHAHLNERVDALRLVKAHLRTQCWSDAYAILVLGLTFPENLLQQVFFRHLNSNVIEREYGSISSWIEEKFWGGTWRGSLIGLDLVERTAEMLRAS
ncbi:hypothetical protein Tco_0045382 [Tanacetum coccineum]